MPAVEWSTLVGAVLSSIALVKLIEVLFGRPKQQAENQVTVGSAWEGYAERQNKEIDGLKRDRDTLRGELKATQKEVAILTRQQHAAHFWQARVMARDEIVGAILQDRGIPVPPMPAPPVVREPNTRADDERTGLWGGE
jgi:hypothetical protein